MSEPEVRPVVIAYDGSEHARAAIAHAGALLGAHRAVVVCVWTPVEAHVPAATIAVPARVALEGARVHDAEAQRRAERLAAEGAELARRAGLAADTRTIRRDGAPWHAIVDCAAQLDAAAIVTGTRGRSQPVAALLGSTAAGVLHHAHRPVLVVSGE